MECPRTVLLQMPPLEKGGLWIIRYKDKKTGSIYDGHYDEDEYKLELLKMKLCEQGANWGDIVELYDNAWSLGGRDMERNLYEH